MTCQNCWNTAEDTTNFTLCTKCRKTYAATLHQLRINLHTLEQVARRQVKLTEHGSGAKTSETPTPINLTMLDLINQAEDILQNACQDAGITPGWDWRHTIPRMMTRLSLLCKAPNAGHRLHQLTRQLAKITPLTDRRPRIRRIIGPCPTEDCQGEITAAQGETWRMCDQCGRLVNIPALKTDMAEAVDKIHLTRTPAGLAEWLHHEYGYQVTRKQVSDWLRRGKLPSSKPVPDSDGYWEFNIREVLAMAMATSKRQ